MANRVQKYLKNLDKEVTQAGNAGETFKKLKGTPKGKAAANKLRNERGQMFGALLQGKRYDENGKQITKPKVNSNTGLPISKTKPTTKTPSKTTTKAPAKKKVVQMPTKISPSKMTPAQKARYLKNPERYDG
jgi:hypothetical protein